MTTRNICVFCASGIGANPRYRQDAQALGAGLAAKGWGLVYGGASIGLMTTVADAALAGGGSVIGVIPAVLQSKEVAHAGLTEQHFVGSMHERKALMADRSHAFLALPGGFGTLDELCEIITWAQLGIHAKPIVLLNTAGFYDGFLSFLRNTVEQRLIQQRHLDRLLVVSSVAEALETLELELEQPAESLAEHGVPVP